MKKVRASFEALGLEPDVGLDSIRRRYELLKSIWLAETGEGNEEPEQELKRVEEAWKVLGEHFEREHADGICRCSSKADRPEESYSEETTAAKPDRKFQEEHELDISEKDSGLDLSRLTAVSVVVLGLFLLMLAFRPSSKRVVDGATSIDKSKSGTTTRRPVELVRRRLGQRVAQGRPSKSTERRERVVLKLNERLARLEALVALLDRQKVRLRLAARFADERVKELQGHMYSQYPCVSPGDSVVFRRRYPVRFATWKQKCTDLSKYKGAKADIFEAIKRNRKVANELVSTVRELKKSKSSILSGGAICVPSLSRYELGSVELAYAYEDIKGQYRELF